ncbi:MAG: hypothetical protein JSR85_07895 [Proteobacteria bacterium]|nr:hypothetical protein [Pseudomonadota bacterium]
MKFYVASLLYFLSGITFMNTSVLGMDDLAEASRSVHSRVKVKRDDLKDFLSKQDYHQAFKSLRKILPLTCPDAEIIDFLMKSNKLEGWEEAAEEDKHWVFSKIIGKVIRDDLEDFLSKQDYHKAFKSLRKDLPPTCSDAEIIDFLMKSNKLEGWEEVAEEDKRWVVFKVTKKPDEAVKEAVESTLEKDEKLEQATKSFLPDPVPGKKDKSILPPPSNKNRLTHATLGRATGKAGRRLPSRAKTLHPKLLDEPKEFNSTEASDHSNQVTVPVTRESSVEALKQARVRGGIQMLVVDFSTLSLKKVDKGGK